MILFRADGNEHIGLGHVMRCLSLADALKKYVNEIAFVLSDSFCENLISQRGFDSIVLQTRYSKLDDELYKIVPLIKSINPSVIIVDSYFVTENYLKSLKECLPTLYFDDLLKFPYPVDLLINYNIFSDLDDYKNLYKNSIYHPKFVLGTKYVPLRTEFSGISIKEQPTLASKVLIMTGGADPLHVSLNLLEYILNHFEVMNNYHFTFVVGAANTDCDRLLDMSKQTLKIQVFQNVYNMSQVMIQNDIAISAAGSTLYELCACGIPTITYSFADNQIPASESFAEKQVMISLGDIRKQKNYISNIVSEIISLCGNAEQRVNMSNAEQRITDGQGAQRLAKVIIRYLQQN